MPGIIAFLTVVEEALEEFGGLFANAPVRRHFGDLTRLVVSERENVSAIQGSSQVFWSPTACNGRSIYRAWIAHTGRTPRPSSGRQAASEFAISPVLITN